MRRGAGRARREARGGRTSVTGDAAAIAPLMDRAAASYAAGQRDAARELCEEILRSDPRHFYALHLAATIAADTAQWEECVRLASRALAVSARHPEVLANRGAALRMLERYDEALADYDLALASSPPRADVLNNRGVALAALNRHAEAIESYDQALAILPDYARARFNRAMSKLVTGDLRGGWRDHEARWRGGEHRMEPRAFATPKFTGTEDVRGKAILLAGEQGIGDMIQCARYAPLLRERGARVILEVHAPLKELVAGMEGVDAAIAIGDPIPAHDLHAHAMSLPLAFDTQLDTIPARVPYLSAPAAHVERWRAKVPEGRPVIGLAWSGNARLRNDRTRSIPLAALRKLRETDATFVSLQKDVRDSDRAALDAAAPILRFDEDLRDFRDTAALVSLADLVVTVDTSVAHLAGAMARRAWVLLPFSPDWRWLLGRDDSPWYPTLRLFRQPRPGDWNSVLDRVDEGVRRFAANAPPA